MALPKIAAPTFELTQPSNGTKLHFRPFLVKEEKILLMAKESKDASDVFNAIKQIINNCVQEDDFSVDNCTIFDMEYIFIKIRSLSIGNEVSFKVVDSDDQFEYEIEVDLNEVEIQFPDEVNRKIEIDNNNGIMLKWLSPAISEQIAKAESEAEINYITVLNAIESVYDEDSVYAWSDSNEDEKNEFLEALPVQVYREIENFLNHTPKIEHVVTYTNSLGSEKNVVFRTLDDFFTLG